MSLQLFEYPKAFLLQHLSREDYTMFPEIQPLIALFALVAERRRSLEVERQARGDAGYSTEAVLATALLAALAVGALTVVAVKVMGRANTIDVGK